MDRGEPLNTTVNALSPLTTVKTVNKWPKYLVHKGNAVNGTVNREPLINSPSLIGRGC